MDIKIIRDEMKRLDQISGLDTSAIPVRISSRMTYGWGKCSYICVKRKYKIKELVFAERLLRYGTMEHILNVIRHEYAHAYVVLTHNEKHGHDAIWKRAAMRFGCNAQRCENFDEVDKIYQYKVICQGCGSVSHYRKKVGIVQELERNPNTVKFYCKKCKSRHFLLQSADNV